MNAGSIVKFLSSRWQVAQVRPLPLKVSLKKRARPLEIRAFWGSGGCDPHAATAATPARSAPVTPSLGSRCAFAAWIVADMDSSHVSGVVRSMRARRFRSLTVDTRRGDIRLQHLVRA